MKCNFLTVIVLEGNYLDFKRLTFEEKFLFEAYVPSLKRT
jgi:hypothetical protein